MLYFSLSLLPTSKYSLALWILFPNYVSRLPTSLYILFPSPEFRLPPLLTWTLAGASSLVCQHPVPAPSHPLSILWLKDPPDIEIDQVTP